MDSKTSIFVLVAILGILNVSGEDTRCLDASYCKLVMGDIARESEKYGKDSKKFYQQAEEGVTLYKKYIQSPDNATREECDRLESTCATEAARMAVEELKFPSKYETTCDYQSYTRTVFDCKNVKNWPQQIKDILPKQSKTCRAECIIIEDTNITLSTGRILNKVLPGGHITGDAEIDSMAAEERQLNSKREIVVQYSAFDDDVKKPGWGELDVCPELMWANRADKITKGDYLRYVEFGCISIRYGGKLLTNQVTEGIRSTPLGEIPTQWGPDYSKSAPEGCRDDATRSFLTGISINSKQFRTYGKIPLYVNFICGATTKWTYPRENGYIETSVPDSRELHCPFGTGICSIQTRSDTFENIKFVVDVRIGCCKGFAGALDFFQTNNFTVTPLPPPPTTAEELLILQKRSGDYFLFWDESEVLNDIITRYNIYFSPATLKDEDVFTETKCPPGQFLGSYELTDPKSCYFQGRRIPRIEFNCTDKVGKKGDKLDIYGRLKDGHTLQDSKYFQSKDCTGGYYTGIEFTYYVDKEYPYLVNAWGLKMKCSSGGSTTDHESVIKAYEKLDLAAHKTEKAAVDCGAGKAVCGFQNKVTDNHSGVFEGLYFKVLCCSVLTS